MSCITRDGGRCSLGGLGRAAAPTARLDLGTVGRSHSAVPLDMVVPSVI